VVADYLYGLTRAFTAFYHACPVLDAPSPVRDGRLRLVDAVRKTLRNGMLVLGMRPLETHVVVRRANRFPGGPAQYQLVRDRIAERRDQTSDRGPSKATKSATPAILP